jgi:hypothetical protein
LTLLSTNDLASNQLKMEALEQSLGSLDLNVPVPNVNDADVLANPLDVYRTYLAQVLADTIGCDMNVAYKSIQWPNNISGGDLAVILPKLRLGAKADEVTIELMKKVRTLSYSNRDLVINLVPVSKQSSTLPSTVPRRCSLPRFCEARFAVSSSFSIYLESKECIRLYITSIHHGCHA